MEKELNIIKTEKLNMKVIIKTAYMKEKEKNIMILEK